MWHLKINNDLFQESEKIAKSPIGEVNLQGVSLGGVKKPSGRYSRCYDNEAADRIRSTPPSSRVRPTTPQPGDTLHQRPGFYTRRAG